VLVDGVRTFSNLPYGWSSEYAALQPVTHTVSVVPAGSAGPALFETQVNGVAGSYWTLAALGAAGAPTPWLLSDDNDLPLVDQCRVRLLHASTDAPAVDVAVEGGANVFANVAHRQMGDYVAVSAGTYDLVVRQTGTMTALLTLPGVTLDAGNVYSLVLLGLRNGTPALRLVAIRDVITTGRTTQASYIVHQAQAGEWKVKLSGYINPQDAYQLAVIGAIPRPGLGDVAATSTGPTSARVTYRLTADRPGTMVNIWANPGPITATHTITNSHGVTETVTVPEYNGTLLVGELQPAYDGSLQTANVSLSALASGAYRIWLEADNDNSGPQRVYAAETVVVTSTWQTSWQANIRTVPRYGEIGVSWDPCPNPDVNGYVLYSSTPPQTVTQAIDVGSVLTTSVWAVAPGSTVELWVQAYDTETGRFALSEKVSVRSPLAEFGIAASTTAPVLAGSQPLTVSLVLTTALSPYPDAVGLYLLRVPDGLTVRLGTAVTIPTPAGVTVSAVLSAAPELAGGEHVVVIEARGGGVTRTLTLRVTHQRPYFTLTAVPAAITLTEGSAVTVTLQAMGFYGHSDPIQVRLDQVPPGLLCTLSAATISAAGQVSLTLQDTPDLSAGVQALHIIGEDGLHVDDLSLPVTVSKRGFGLIPVEAWRSTSPGGQAVFPINVTASLGWSEPVTLSVDASQLPVGTSVSLRAGQAASVSAIAVITATASITVRPPASVDVVVTVPVDAPVQTYPIAVYGESADHYHWASLQLQVRQPHWLYLPLLRKR